jgi:hypothetical protein
MSIYSHASAAPSPHPHRDRLEMRQIALLRTQLKKLRTPGDRANLLHETPKSGLQPTENGNGMDGDRQRMITNIDKPIESEIPGDEDLTGADNGSPDRVSQPDEDAISMHSKDMYDSDEDDDDMVLHSEDPIETRLRQITELLIQDRHKRRSVVGRRRSEKRQVIFVIANYFVLFLSLIALSAEIQARIPQWLAWIEAQMQNVNTCAADKDALFKCVENGDFAGLIASVVLWLSRSVATRRIFLFGFDTPKKLWTVVYECLVTSVCWGFSYIFVRRGLNPDTRPKFLQKYWKDAVYGSLAGFNAAFMKQVLKNLIPQEAVEDVLRDRQLKILSWLPSFH